MTKNHWAMLCAAAVIAALAAVAVPAMLSDRDRVATIRHAAMAAAERGEDADKAAEAAARSFDELRAAGVR
jgi:hypothetical protein